MCLFGVQPKPEPVETVPFAGGDMFEEPFDALPSLPKAQDNTVIAKGITFTGTLHGEGSVQVEGRLDGEIDLKGTITIAETGIVKGPVTADVVRVAGEVQGSITARENLCLERTGCIHGDVATASLVVENGRLDGSSTMLAPPERPKEPEISSDDLQFDDTFSSDL